MESSEYLSVLNPEQLSAVTHEGSPLLILAGAGSGKTRVITTKIAWLIAERGVRPSSILAVTFTKKAAREMQDRATLLESRAARSQIRTFHSFGSWFLRIHADDAGIDRNFTVYDDDDMVTLVTKALPGLAKKQASHIAHKISIAKDYCMLPDDPNLVQIESDPEFPAQYEAYQERLRSTGNVDFGDLILLPVLLLQNNDSVRDHMHRLFSVIMVDEYQDTNVAQFKLVKALAGPETYVCVVGDDDQSIYSFRGAEVQNILSFEKEFPGTQVIRLERNYRSVAPVLAIADQVVKRNVGRLGKTLRAERGNGKRPTLVFMPTQDDEAGFCAELVSQSHKKGVPFADWAILYRTNAQSLGFETEFLHRKIPYTVVGSLKFYEREEIKDALAYLAFLVNPRDEIAFRRIVNKPARGIGAVTQEKIVERAREDAKGTLSGEANLLEAMLAMQKGAAKKAREGLSSFYTLMTDCIQLLDADTARGATPVETLAQEAGAFADPDAASQAAPVDLPDVAPAHLSDFLKTLIQKSGILEYHQSQDEISGTQREFNLSELVNSAALYPANRAGLLEFLDHIELDRTLENPDDAEATDAVTLITLHNTKGLEFPRVVITGMEYGIFPRRDKVDEDLEEERRLFYVGITRARDELYLTSCAYRRMFGKTEDMEISPFLTEISPKDIDVLGTQPALYRRFVSRALQHNASQRNASQSKAASVSGDTGTAIGRGAGAGATGGAWAGSASGSSFAGGADPTNDAWGTTRGGAGADSFPSAGFVPDGAEPDFDEKRDFDLERRWKRGRTVYHDDYGTGAIVGATYTDSGEYVIDVQFETGSRKKFMPKYQANRLMLEF